jgi:hypothetical protein
MCALLFPGMSVAQQPPPTLEQVDVVTVYHPFGFDEADQPFRIRGPLFVHHDHLEALLSSLGAEKGVLIEVCPLKVLPNNVFGLYVGKEERQKACRLIPGKVETEQVGESR